MSRYNIKFKKQGYLRYTSHLDIMRFFQRTFKRADIKLLYSHGFNPHPKMSIAQPLSLGYTSTGDYIEIETEKEHNANDMMITLNHLMPDGLEVINVKAISQGKKTLAALVEYGEYQATLTMKAFDQSITIEPFMLTTKIEVKKIQRKTGIESIIDIKPLINSLTQNISYNNIMLTMIIRNGSTANLNPEMLVGAYLDFYNLKDCLINFEINRNELFYISDGKITKLIDYN